MKAMFVQPKDNVFIQTHVNAIQAMVDPPVPLLFVMEYLQHRPQLVMEMAHALLLISVSAI